MIFRLIKAAVDGRRPNEDDLREFNAELALTRRDEKLAYSHGGFQLDWDGDNPIERTLWTLVQSAADILTSDRLAKIKQCGGDDCGWMFLDTSRSGNRSWCDMKDCGNLAKVHRFRERKAALY